MAAAALTLSLVVLLLATPVSGDSTAGALAVLPAVSDSTSCPEGQFHYTVQAGDTCNSLAEHLCLDYAYYFTVLNNQNLSADCWDVRNDGGRSFNRTRCEMACWQGLYSGVELCLFNHTAELPAGGLCSNISAALCGSSIGRHCPYPLCCSAYGYCSIGADFCELGCQSSYGQCTNSPPVVLTCPSNTELINSSFPNGNNNMIGLAPHLADQVYHVVQPGETCDSLTNQLCVHHSYFFNVVNYNARLNGSCWHTEGDSEYPRIAFCEGETNQQNCWTGLFTGVQLCLANFTAKLRPGELCSHYDKSPDAMRCGSVNGRHCPYPLCCSGAGWCGIGQAWCEQGCQLDYGLCKQQQDIQYTQGLGRCGKPSKWEQGNPNSTALKCPQDTGETPQCCSAFGWCGITDAYCNGWTACQGDYGWCNTTANASSLPPGYTYPGGRCGKQTAVGLRCVDGECCSAQGYCGYGLRYCNADSQAAYGNTVVPPYLAANLTESYSIGAPCGPSAGPNGGLRCPAFSCCSEYGICGSREGDVDEFSCGAVCLPAYSAYNGTPGSCAPTLQQLGTGPTNAQMNPPQPRLLLLGALQPADKKRPWHLAPLDISFHNVRNPTVCLLLCEQAPDCVVWAYNAKNATCYRSSSNLTSSQADSSNIWTSGTRNRAFGTAYLPHTLLVEDGMRYFGAAPADGNPNPSRFVFSDGLQYRLPKFGSKQPTANDCEDVCRTDLACKVFAYNKKTRECFRYNNAFYGGKPAANYVSGIVRHGGSPDDRLIEFNASAPEPGCMCDEPQLAKARNFTRVPLTDATARYTVPLVCKKRNPAVIDPLADGYFVDSVQVAACRRVYGVSGRVCVRGVQRCVDLCVLAKHGGHQGSDCDYYHNALARYETAFLGKECAWKLMTFGHLDERVLCDGRRTGGKRGTGPKQG